MRILILNHFPLQGSGSGIVTENLALQLAQRGYLPWVITPDNRKKGAPTSFPMTTIRCRGPETLSQPVDLPFNFPTFTIHSFSSMTFGALSSGQRAQYVRAWENAVQNAIDQHQPDVIHSQHIWVASYVATRTGIPTVITSHGTDLIGFEKYPAYREMALAAARDAGHIIVNSSEGLAWIRRLYGFPPEKLTVIKNGYNSLLFKPVMLSRRNVLARLGLSNSKILIITVGRLAEIKGLDVLLHAAVRYEAAWDDVQTVIAGAGDQREALESLAKSLDLKHVHFVGYLPHDALADLYNVADLGVFPSHTEIFGLTALESMACGTPVVTTAQGGYLDFVDDRVGALVPVNNAEALAQVIIREIEGQAKAHKGAHTARVAREGFSWNAQIEHFIRVYEQVTAGDRHDIPAF